MKKLLTLKKIIKAVACSFWVLSMTVSLMAENVIYLPDISVNASEDIIISVEVTNEDSFVGFQFDIPLPEGFDYKLNTIALNPERKADHIINANVLPGTNMFRVLSFSLSNSAYKGNSGVLTFFTLTTPNVAGSYDLVIEDAFFGNHAGQNIITGIVNGTVTLLGEELYTVTFVVKDQNQVTVQDATITMGSISNIAGDYIFPDIEPGIYEWTIIKEGYTSESGEITVLDQDVTIDVTINEIIQNSNIMKLWDTTAQVGENIVINMEIINDDTFVGFQFDILLPEAFEYVPNTIALNPSRMVDHLIQASVLQNTNIFRVMSFSLTNAAYYGNSGAIASFTLSTPTIAGIYHLVINNATIGNPNAQNIITGTENGIVTLTELQSYSVTFVVKNQNQEPLSGATVTLGAITNNAGDYIFPNINPGNYSWTVIKYGFITTSGEIMITDQNVIVDVTLQELVPEFCISPENKDFGIVNIYTQSDPQLFTIKNIGEGLLEITNVELRLLDIDQFILSDNNFYPVSLSINDSLVFEISFAPTDLGNKTAILTVTDALSRIMHDVTLTGTGYTTSLSLPFEEDFTDVEPNEIPTGWGRSHVNWGVVKSNNAGGTSPEMIFSDNPMDKDIFKLTTPAIYFDDESIITLYFKHMVKDFANTPDSYTLSLASSVDYGQTWITHWNEQPFDDIPPKIIEIDLSSLSGNTCMLAWIFDGFTSDISSWYIDDILICHVPHNRTIMNESISEQACYDAVNSINISQVTINNGGYANFVSGKTIFIQPSISGFRVEEGGIAVLNASQNIIFQPNTSIKAGAHMKAEIATLSYCCLPAPLIAAKYNKEWTDNETYIEIEEIKTLLRIFPNPTSGRLNIYIDENVETNTKLEIFNMMGNMVLQNCFYGNNQFEIDLTALPNGIYLLKITFDKNSSTIRVIKQ